MRRRRCRPDEPFTFDHSPPPHDGCWLGLDALERRVLLSAAPPITQSVVPVDLAVTGVTTTLKDVLIPGDRGKVSAVITQLGAEPVVSTLPLIVEWVGEGDVRTTLATMDAKLSLKPGRSATFSIPVTIGLDWPVGEGAIAVRFDGSLIDDGNDANDAAQDARGYDLRHQFGNVVGRSGSAKLIYVQDSETVTLSLSGREGFGEITFDDDGVPSIHLMQTTMKTSAKVSVKGGDRVTEIAQVTIDDDLRSFDGKAADLSGDFHAGGLLGSLTLRDVSDAALSIDGIGFPQQKVRITLAAVEDVSLESSLAISTLKATQWLDVDENDVIAAPSISSLTIAGDFEANLALTDTINRPTLGGATIGGTLRDAQWRIAGHVGAVKAASVDSFALLAGLDPDADPAAIEVADFARDVEIRSFTVTGHRQAPEAAAVTDLLLAAARLGTVKLTRLDDAPADGPHGIVTTFIKRLDLTVLGEAATLKASSLDDQATYEALLASTGMDPGDFTVTLLDPPQFSPAIAFDVAAVAETVPVPSSGDAADDIALWVDPDDASQSLILGTNKAGGAKGGIYLYDLAGDQVASASVGQSMNNIDLRYGFEHDGDSVDVAAVSNRTAHAIDLFIIDGQGRALVAAGSISLDEPTLADFGEAYGLTMHHDRDEDRFYVFVSDKSGHIAQFELLSSGGQITGQLVRHWKERSVVEGMVVDDESGLLYLGEETRGIYVCEAAPDAMTASAVAAPPPADRALVDDMTGPLDADVEGLAIYRTAAGQAYLIASSQGSSRYVIYDAATFRRLAVLRIIATPDGAIDGTSDTDGIEAIAGDFGPQFPLGLFIVQDGSNSGGQNYKLLSWADLMDAGQTAGVTLEGDGLFDPRDMG